MPESYIQDDQRQFLRVNLELKGIYRVLDREREEGCAEIQNLSNGGMMFISSAPLLVGDLLDMTVYYLDFEIPIHAKVIWAEQLSGIEIPDFKYGLEYVKISNVDRSYILKIIASNHELS